MGLLRYKQLTYKIMRKIKFRAWNTSSKKMYPLAQITFPGGGTWSVEKGEGVSMEYQPHILLMQYTGLKDKNGKGIWEGDIVKRTWLDAPNQIIVEWKEGLGQDNFGVGFNLWPPTDSYEVIGNIHQNPELLEKSVAQ